MRSEKEKLLTNYQRSLEATTFYEIGKHVAQSRNSLTAAIKLPFHIYKIIKRQKKLSSSQFKTLTIDGKLTSSEEKITLTANAAALVEKHGADMFSLINNSTLMHPDKKNNNKVLLEVGKMLAVSDSNLASTVLNAITPDNDSIDIMKEKGFAFYAAGNLSKANKYLNEARTRTEFSKDEKISFGKIKAEEKVLVNGFSLPAKTDKYPLDNTRILYVSHLSLSYNTTGYAIRTHNIVKSIKEHGYDIECVTRPGYPWDRKDILHRKKIKKHNFVEGVHYTHYQTSNLSRLPFTDYVNKAAETLYAHILNNEITSVIAASNYANALPALIASRKAGIHFTYDVRGLWEYSQSTKVRNWEYTERFALSQRLETLVSNGADRVITISSKLKQKLIARGVSSKINVALNCVSIPTSSENHNKREDIHDDLKIPKGAIVLGYIGSIEAYEGLDNLLLASEKLILDGQKVYILIIGDGSHRHALHNLGCQLNIIENIRILDRMDHEEACRVYAGIDIAIYPRLDNKACQLVPPLKPLEAMAYKRPVIISNLPPIIELLHSSDQKKSCIFIRPNDVNHLVSAINHLTQDKELNNKIAKDGFEFAKNNRLWKNSSSLYLNN